MHKKLKKGLTAGVLAASLLALSACGGGGDTAPEAGATFDKDSKAKIVFSWWGNDDRATRFEEALSAFNEVYPNVEVVRNFNSWGDYWTARNTEAAGRSLPDVVMMDAGYLGEYASKGLLLDLEPYRDSILPLDGVPENVLGAGTVSDELVSVPLGTNAWSMMYNKDLLDELGVAYPTGKMTESEFDDFLLEVNQAGSTQDPRKYGADDYTGGFPGFIYHLLQSGNVVFNDDGSPAFTEQDVTDYLDMGQAFRDSEDFYPIERSIALAPLGGFLGGESAVWFNFSTTVLQAMTDIGSENLGMVQPPLKKGQDQHVLAAKPSLLLSVAKNSKEPQAATALIEFLTTSPKTAEIFGTSLGTPPTQEGRDAIEQIPADTINLDYLDSVADEMTASYPILPAGYGTIEARWSELHERMRYGEIDTKQFTAELFDEIALILGS